MAKGNDGNYLQHCIEIEAAARLVKYDTKRRLHIALTHGMAPFEKLGGPNNNVCHDLLYDALNKSQKSPQYDEKECLIVDAYRKTGASHKCYPNTAQLLRTIIGKDKLYGGITECDDSKHETLAKAWSGSNVNVCRSSWRKQRGSGGVLRCPDELDKPWMFSMDPMSYTEYVCKEDDNSNRLHRSDRDLLACTLGRYVGSEQPGFASLFVYAMDDERRYQFWKFVDDLASQLRIKSCSYWVPYNKGKCNLASLLYTDIELMSDFIPHGIKLMKENSCPAGSSANSPEKYMIMGEEMMIYCADIGAVKDRFGKNQFGWARLAGKQSDGGNCIVAFVDNIACDMAKGRKVALGFECPLWVPVSAEPQCLTHGRQVDENRAWSAGSGATVLATGITQVAWILEKLKSRLKERGTALPPVHLDWSEFAGDDSGLFLWEAFVTDKAKAPESEGAQRHAKDALTACREFAKRLPEPAEKCEPEPRVRSLIGGAVLWAGWSKNMKLLHMPCIVVRPDARG